MKRIRPSWRSTHFTPCAGGGPQARPDLQQPVRDAVGEPPQRDGQARERVLGTHARPAPQAAAPTGSAASSCGSRREITFETPSPPIETP